MSISQFPPAAAASGDNDFVLSVGVTGNTTYDLGRTHSSGSYTIEFANGDTTYDIYFIAEDGTYAGYTNTASVIVAADFSEVVVLGAANSETILFTYQGSLASPSTTGDVTTAGAFINSVVTSSLPNIDDTTVVNGGNFAADVEVSFIDQSEVETAAKNVVRNSSTQLIVTRPDSFSPGDSPYTVKVVNPGIPVPAGTNAHLLVNAVTAGTNPTWVTGTTIYYRIEGASSITLEATDTEGSDIDYSVVTGTLPAGLSLDEETGVISGTFSGSANEGDVTSVTIRATDAGGNFLDKAFDFTANAGPTWSTPSGNLTTASTTSSYSYQLVASDAQSITYSIVSGSLPGGLSLSTSGLISGTPNGTAGTTFTVSAEDSLGMSTTRDFYVPLAILEQINASTTWTAPSGVTSVEYALVAGGGSGADYGGSNASAGGGGAGGVLAGTIAVTPGQGYPVVIGAGGASTSGGDANGNYGNNSTAFGLTAIRGGYGATAFEEGGNGGSGGGASRKDGGSGTPGQGNDGGQGLYQDTGSGGGGKATAGQNPTTTKSGDGGSGASYFGVAVGGGGGGGSAVGYTRGNAGFGGGGVGGPSRGNGSANTGGGGGGGGGSDTSGGAGGSGTLLLQYVL